MTATVVEIQDPEWTLGDRIAKVRKILGLQQEELGELLGVSGPAISSWEGDKRRPRNVLKVARDLEQISADRGVPIEAAWIAGFRTGSCATGAHDPFRTVGRDDDKPGEFERAVEAYGMPA